MGRAFSLHVGGSMRCTEDPLRPREQEMGRDSSSSTFEGSLGCRRRDHNGLVRSMVKQGAARMGLHATVMTRPGCRITSRVDGIAIRALRR